MVSVSSVLLELIGTDYTTQQLRKTMNENINPLEGVSLQTLTINAASPDVLGAVLKRITDETMKLIPDDTIKNIAKDVIEGKEVVIGKDNYSGTYQKTITWSASTSVNKAVSEAFKDDIVKATNKIRESEEYKTAVRSIALMTAREFLREGLPNMAMQHFAQQQLNIHSDQSDWHRQSLTDLRSAVLTIANQLNLSVAV